MIRAKDHKPGKRQPIGVCVGSRFVFARLTRSPLVRSAPLNWRTGSPTSALGRILLTLALTMGWAQAKPLLLEVWEAPIEPQGIVFAEQINPLAAGQT